MSVQTETTTAQGDTKADAATTAGDVQTQTAIASTEEKNQTQAAQAPVVPEKYDLKAPEGSLLSKDRLDAIAEYAKAEKLTAEQAQKLLDREHGAVDAYAKAQQQEYDRRIAAWVDESRGDKEIGGDALNKNVELTKRFVAKFFDPAVAKFINDSGYGNQKEVIRGFVRIIKAAGFGEDTLVLPGSQGGGQKRVEDLFYPQQAAE